MKAPSLVPPGPKGPAIPAAPKNLVPKPKASMPRIRTIKHMMMRKGGAPAGVIHPFMGGG